jgi:hypothetical protein
MLLNIAIFQAAPLLGMLGRSFVPAFDFEILYSTRAILHNPDIYPDPFSFKPERFLKESGKVLPLDPETVAFGYGRR